MFGVHAAVFIDAGVANGSAAAAAANATVEGSGRSRMSVANDANMLPSVPAVLATVDMTTASAAMSKIKTCTEMKKQLPMYIILRQLVGAVIIAMPSRPLLAFI